MVLFVHQCACVLVHVCVCESLLSYPTHTYNTHTHMHTRTIDEGKQDVLKGEAEDESQNFCIHIHARTSRWANRMYWMKYRKEQKMNHIISVHTDTHTQTHTYTPVNKGEQDVLDEVGGKKAEDETQPV